MWCTRWYIPLLILPFSRASPLFLLAFLFSLTLQARPCLYCVVLLTALAQSSCYWQPVPADDIYSSPSRIIPSDDPPLQGHVRLVDRCWCDLALGSFFQPFNVTKWETLSLEREKDLRARKRNEETETDSNPVESSIGVHNSTSHFTTDTQIISSSKPPSRSQRALTQFGSWWKQWGVEREKEGTASADDTKEYPSHNSQPVPQSTPRYSYDLRPHGFGLVLDYGWGRS